MHKNLLFYGDNLDVLRRDIKDETVDLCYIDPPFNSKRSYNQIYNNIGHEDRAQAQAFIDTWLWDDHARECYEQVLFNANSVQTQQSIDLVRGLESVLGRGSLFAYLVNMTVRIAEIRRVLKPKGSFYLHCDPTASHYLKLICDGIFVSQGGDFKNEIAWQRTSAHNDPARYGRVHDSILYYTKSGKHVWNQYYDLPDEKYFAAHDFERDEEGRLYRKRDLTAPAHGNQSGQYEWKGLRPPKGRMWSYTKENMERLESEGRIVYTRTGMPRLKIYAEDLKGIPYQDVWARPELWLNSAAGERQGYPTQKPEALLDRIIKTSSNEGDTVLDAYCGCGTTTAVAQRLKRRWVGVDITYQSISLVLSRLEQTFGKEVLDYITLDGIPRDVESAVALAHKKDDRVRKEFEKWAVLTYTNNRAIINSKKGADRGIDGTAYFMANKKDNAKIIFQVKSGGVKRSDIATLRGDMERENAAMAILITLEQPTRPMIEEAKAAGSYRHETMNKSYDRIQIVTVKEIIEQDKRLNIPMSLEVIKAARRAASGSQIDLEYNVA